MTSKTKTKTKPKPRTPAGRAKEYVVDEKGRRTAVVLPIRTYERLLQAFEDLEDIRAADEARAEPGESIPWEVVKAELRAKGKAR